MRKHLLLLPLLALATPAAAQHTELIGRAALGLFQFGGPDAVAGSFINYSNYTGSEGGYTNSPYGSKLGAGFALGGRMQHVSKGKVLVALDLGYEWLQSRTSINRLYYSAGYANTSYSAEGTTCLRTQNITAFLGVGRRFELPKVQLDILLGPEIVGIFKVNERGSGSYNNGNSWATKLDRGISIPFDARLRADATVWYRRLGFNASYSYGFANYQSGLVGASPEVYARVLRLGLAYRLK